jgi:hypothetical protein
MRARPLAGVEGGPDGAAEHAPFGVDLAGGGSRAEASEIWERAASKEAFKPLVGEGVEANHKRPRA